MLSAFERDMVGYYRCSDVGGTMRDTAEIPQSNTPLNQLLKP